MEVNLRDLKLVDAANRVYQLILPDGRIVEVGKKRHTYNAVDLRRSIVTQRSAIRWAWMIINEATGQVCSAEGFESRRQAVEVAVDWARKNPSHLVVVEIE